MFRKTVTTDYKAGESAAEMEKHKKEAQATLGEHVRMIGNTTRSVPLDDVADGEPTHSYHMTSVWEIAPPPPGPTPDVQGEQRDREREQIEAANAAAIESLHSHSVTQPVTEPEPIREPASEQVPANRWGE